MGDTWNGKHRLQPPGLGRAKKCSQWGTFALGVYKEEGALATLTIEAAGHAVHHVRALEGVDRDKRQGTSRPEGKFQAPAEEYDTAVGTAPREMDLCTSP